MPYIIETKTPQPGLVPGEAIQVRTPPLVSRRAVATLDEARAVARHKAGLPDPSVAPTEGQLEAWYAIRHMTEQGGTIGPLPDGTVIEVEHVTWRELHFRAGSISGTAGPSHSRRIIDAYNAAQ